MNKYRVQLVTGDIVRCEGFVGVDGEAKVYAIHKMDEEKVTKNVVFSAPIHQVIYISAEEAVVDPKP